VKLSRSGWAAAYVASPGCEAQMVQIPVLLRVATVPETLHTSGVTEVKLTGNWELAVATRLSWVPCNCAPMGLKVMVWVASTLKLCLTGWAAAYVALPGCEAQMVQVPVLLRVATVPETVHTSGVTEVKLTGIWELAVATKLSGVPCNCAPMGLKVMVWVACTLKLCRTGWAAAYMALPLCEAQMVQIPVLLRVATVPETVHMSVVAEAKLTGNWELAVATRLSVPSNCAPMGLKVMVWVANTVKLWFTGWAGA